ncbi:MAG: histidine phosphatase family protein, partial [Pseudomonadota bacterium]
PGGELFTDAYDRIKRGLEVLISQHDWRSALLVAHDGTNRILLGHACGAGLSGIAHFEQDLACVNVLDFDVVLDENDLPKVIRTIIKAVNLTAYDMVKEGLPRTSLEHLFDIDFGGARPLE